MGIAETKTVWFLEYESPGVKESETEDLTPDGGACVVTLGVFSTDEQAYEYAESLRPVTSWRKADGVTQYVSWGFIGGEELKHIRFSVRPLMIDEKRPMPKGLI